MNAKARYRSRKSASTHGIYFLGLAVFKIKRTGSPEQTLYRFEVNDRRRNPLFLHEKCTRMHRLAVVNVTGHFGRKERESEGTQRLIFPP